MRLPCRFDVARALEEALALPADLWRTHFNQGRHDGGWQALALRVAPDAPMDVVPMDAAPHLYTDTAALAQCPDIRSLLQSLALPFQSVRLMRLLPGSEIMEHTDAGVCAANGEARLHIPLQTDEQVFFHIDGERLPMRAGECWYTDVSLPHRVRNRSDRPRIHLVMDALVDMRLFEAFKAGDAGDPMRSDRDPWAAFARFQQAVFADANLASALAPSHDLQTLSDRSVQMGRELGFAFEASDVESAMRAGAQSVGGTMDCLNTLRGWRPIRLFWNGSRVMVDWARLGDAPLSHPFYQDSVGELLRLPFHNAFRRLTSLDELLAWHEQSPGIAPSLVVFHVSRCGSTLISQAFCQSPRHLGLSEPAPVDFLLRVALLSGYLTEAQVAAALRAWVSAWSQRSEPGSPPLSAVTLKLDSWCNDRAHLIEQAWPGVFKVFLTREPLSVLVSQTNERAMFLVPGVLGVNFGLPDVGLQEQCVMPAGEYCARMLGRIYADMLAVADPATSLVLDHAELPAAIEEQLLPRMPWVLHADEAEAMRERLTRHGKRPHQPFEGDTATKHAAASAELRALANRWMEPHYRALLQKRSTHRRDRDTRMEALT